MDFRTLLKTKEFVILDGAMGTMLQAKGLEMGGTPEALNIDKPDWLVDIHRQYINAGSVFHLHTKEHLQTVKKRKYACGRDSRKAWYGYL